MDKYEEAAMCFWPEKHTPLFVTVDEFRRVLSDFAVSYDEHYLQPAIDAAVKGAVEKRERHIRQVLWLSHGCDINALYGDDGEMQCSKCGIDFLRFPIEAIIPAVSKRRESETCETCKNWHMCSDGCTRCYAISFPLGTPEDFGCNMWQAPIVEKEGE